MSPLILRGVPLLNRWSLTVYVEHLRKADDISALRMTAVAVALATHNSSIMNLLLQDLWLWFYGQTCREGGGRLNVGPMWQTTSAGPLQTSS